MTKLFVSYRSLDSAKVDAIVTRLRTLKNPDNTSRYDIWQDKTSIPVGQDWWKSIVQGIIDCDVFVFMVSHESVKNPNCRAELSYARKRNRAIIPLVLENEYAYNSQTGKNDIDYWDDVPDELKDGRFQFLFYEGVSFVSYLDHAIELLTNLGLRDIPAPEPPDPRDANDATNDTGLIYHQACDFAWRKEFATAEKFFQRLLDWRDPYFENEAYEWIIILRSYEQIVRFDARTSSRYRVQSMWDEYAKQFPKPFTPLFDPYDLNSRYNRDKHEADSMSDEPPEQVEQATSEPTSTQSVTPKYWDELLKPDPNINVYTPSPPPVNDNSPSPSQSKRRVPFIPILVVIGIIGIVLLAGMPRGDNMLSESIATAIPSSVATHITPDTPVPTDTPTTSTLELEKIAKTPVTSNGDWTPIEHDFDRMTMVLVPIGCFMMGSDNGDNDERPVQEECIEEPFWIGKYEVTNSQYGSIKCDSTSSKPNQPRNCVDWFDATAFCQELGKRLPTEKEWEYVARGPDNLVYPWGNDWNADYAVWDGNSGYQTAEVGSRRDGVSWVGAYDMSGNVWEWTSSFYTASYPYTDRPENESDTINRRVLRGGSWHYYSSASLRLSDRSWLSPDSALPYNGFRCVHSQL